ncbi:hypothetical protein B0H19DRAFT_1096672 [Mycena capillaripes]|nr:hypothetical protein B0H19DRAFT_1096672 [Mycena capillaripes]
MAQFFLNCGAPPSTLPLLLDPPSEAFSPDLTHLLTSNNPPLESEIPSVCAVISEGEDRIRPLDAHIDALKAQIQDLRDSLTQFVRRRNEAAEYVRQRRAILSPVQRLSPELIYEILGLTWASSCLEDEDRVPEPTWYLGHICGPWRLCALSYPTLWSSITVL